MSHPLSELQEAALKAFAHNLINQQVARPIVFPEKAAPGFWVGGGNLLEVNGRLYLSGRYRNYGDSRLGTQAGTRGFELAVFKSTDEGGTFEKIISFSKQDLEHAGLPVISIEGSFLHWNGKEVELYFSTEKGGLSYPQSMKSYQKPHTGVWTIDRISAPCVEDLDPQNITEIIRGDDPQYLHIKDPFGYVLPTGDFMLLFCTHPYSWSSSNTGYITRKKGQSTFGAPNYTFFPRGTTWDVAITRGTALLKVPRIGQLADAPDITLLFYDGGECFRNLDENKQSISRPRGYSCEEIGGAAYLLDNDFHNIKRLSVNLPMFTSPYGLRTSRYVDVLQTERGFYATWQQSQEDGSQPLVMHFLSTEEVNEILK